jgi:hypothetical protein
LPGDSSQARFPSRCARGSTSANPGRCSPAKPWRQRELTPSFGPRVPLAIGRMIKVPCNRPLSRAACREAHVDCVEKLDFEAAADRAHRTHIRRVVYYGALVVRMNTINACIGRIAKAVPNGSVDFGGLTILLVSRPVDIAACSFTPGLSNTKMSVLDQTKLYVYFPQLSQGDVGDR